MVFRELAARFTDGRQQEVERKRALAKDELRAAIPDPIIVTQGVENIAKKFGLSREDVREVVTEEVTLLLKERKDKHANEVAHDLWLSPEEMSSILNYYLQKEDAVELQNGRLKRLLELFKVPFEQVRSVLEEKAREKTREGYFQVAQIVYLDVFPEGEDFFARPENKDMCREGALQYLLRETAFWEIRDRNKFSDTLRLDDVEIVAILREAAPLLIRQGKFTRARALFSLGIGDEGTLWAEEFVRSSEIHQAFIDRISAYFSEGHAVLAKTYIMECKRWTKRDVETTDQMIHDAQAGVIVALKRGDWSSAFQIRQVVGLSETSLDAAAVHTASVSGVKKLLSENRVGEAIVFAEKQGIADKPLSLTADLFGEQATIEGYYAASVLLEERELIHDLKTLGVTTTGTEGIKQLRKTLRAFQKDAVNGVADYQRLENPLLRSVFRKLVRFDESEWGEHGDQAFKNLAETHFDNYVGETFARLPEYLEGRSDVEVYTLTEVIPEETRYTEGFLPVYGRLVDALEGAQESFTREDALSHTLQKMQEMVTEMVREMEEKIPSFPNEQAQEAMRKRIEALQKADPNKSGWQEVFTVLAEQKDLFTPHLREVLFWWSLQFHPQYAEQISGVALRKETPTVEDMSFVLNFVNHITNKETLRQYFTDARAAKSFRRVLNVHAVEEELSRFQNRGRKGTMKIRMSVHRDLFTELSGHIGDACWAQKYNSILQEFPNISSLIFAQNADDERFARLVGSALLIETNAQDGTPLLVIRGLNPIENVINQMDVKHFFETVVGYVQPKARKAGRSLAIVIDNHSGGSGTNRPVLFAFLEALKPTLRNIPLASKADTTFNEYDIDKCTYLLPV